MSFPDLYFVETGPELVTWQNKQSLQWALLNQTTEGEKNAQHKQLFHFIESKYTLLQVSRALLRIYGHQVYDKSVLNGSKSHVLHCVIWFS